MSCIRFSPCQTGGLKRGRFENPVKIGHMQVVLIFFYALNQLTAGEYQLLRFFIAWTPVGYPVGVLGLNV